MILTNMYNNNPTANLSHYPSGGPAPGYQPEYDMKTTAQTGGYDVPQDLSFSTAYGCTSGATATTPSFSAQTSLPNFEAPFIDLQPIVSNNNTQQSSGFVPPLVEPQGYNNYDNGKNSQWMPQHANNQHRNVAMVRPNMAMPQIRGTFISRRPHDEINPEEAHRKRVRRERNKLAAARCRQRRTDLTNKLMDETEVLEDEQHNLEDQIEKLRQQKEQYEFILKAHQASCKAPEDVRCKPLPTPTPISASVSVIVKQEPKTQHDDFYMKGDEYDALSPSSTCSSEVSSNSMTQTKMAAPAAPVARPHTLPIPASSANSTSTSVPTKAQARSALTPGSVFTLGFETMLDGSTGLTPIAGPSCASQAQRNSSDSSNNSDNNMASPTLMAL
ncbi:unnamed protein product [Owenia fusiformis]|uniref:Uncharacterized protein n=1 Tax=Owenia fusiformis TaxID=6347 RepID=A0A8J1U2L6_OWEFU|nr:unnamed protein product [Owenia fusiformis]